MFIQMAYIHHIKQTPTPTHISGHRTTPAMVTWSCNFAAKNNIEMDRSYFDSFEFNLNDRTLTMGYIVDLIEKLDQPGQVYFHYYKSVILVERGYEAKHTYYMLSEIIEDVISLKKRDILRKQLTMRDFSQYNKYSALYAELEDSSSSEEESFDSILPVLKKIKKIKKNNFDDESWFNPTGVYLPVMEEKKIKNSRCVRVQRIVDSLSANIILRDYTFEIIVKHCEKCISHQCSLKDRFSTIVNKLNAKDDWHSSSKLSKPIKELEPQMFSFFGGNNVNKAAEDVSNSSGKFSNLCDSISGFIKEKKDKVVNTDNHYKSLAYQMLKNLIFFSVSPSGKMAAATIVATLLDIGVANLSVYNDIIGPLNNLFSSVENQPTKSNSIEPNLDESWQKSWASVLSSLIAVILTAFELKSMPLGDRDGIMKGLFVTTRNVWFLNMLFKQVLEDVLKCVSRIWEWCMRKVFGPTSLKHIFLQEPKFLEEWATDVQYLTNSCLEDEILEDIDLSYRVIERNIQGKILSVYLAGEKVKERVHPIILSLIEKISKMYDKIVERSKFSPARYVPFVVWLSGPPNIGKSFIVRDIADALLKTKNIISNDPVYTRSPGSPFFNTLRGQEAICYDDFLAVKTEGAADHLAEFYALKTCAPYNPPMADIPDKKRYYNPYLMFVTSNQDFPKHSKVEDHHAFYRRRDVLVQCKLSVSGKIITDFSAAELKAKSHLNFDRWDKDKTKPNDYSATGGTYLASENYSVFIDNVVRKFKDYDQVESINLANRIKLCNTVLLEQAVKTKRISDAPSKFYDELIKLSETSSNAHLIKLIDTVKNLRTVKPEMQDNPYVFNPPTQTSLTVKYIKDQSVYKTDAASINSIKTGQLGIMIDYTQCSVFLSQELEETAFRPNGCLHDWFSKLTNNYKLQFSFVSEFLDKQDGLAYRGEHPYMGGEFTALVPFVEQFPESGYFIPDAKCSDVACSYVKADFVKEMELNYNKHVAVSRRVEVPTSLVVKKFPPGDLKSDKIIKRAFARFSEDIEDAFWVITDGDKKYAFAKQNNLEKSWYVKVFELLKVIGRWLLYIIGIMFCFYGIKKIVNFSRSSSREDVYEDLTDLNGQMDIPSGDAQTRKIQQTNRYKGKIQGQMDEQYLQSIYNGVERNTFFIMCYDKSETSAPIVARCLGLFDNVGIGLLHYFERFSLCEDNVFKIAFKVKHHYAYIDININEIKLEKFKDSGLVMMEIPWRVPAFKDIRERFYPRSEVLEISKSCELLEIQLGDVPKHYHKKVMVTEVKDTWVEGSYYSKGWNIISGFSYPYGGKGVCGSILITLTKRPSIIGIHTSGSAACNFGISEIITREDLVSVTKMLGRIYPQMDDADEAKFQLEGPIVALGCEKHPVRMSETSKIIPSIVHGIYDVLTAPAPLSIRDPRVNFAFSPLKYGCEKQTLMCKPLNVLDVDMAVDSLFNKLDKFVVPLRVMTDLTYLESVNGLGIDGYDSMELSTSEGYPWIKNRPRNAVNKRYLFEFNQDRVVDIDKNLVSVMDQKHNLRNDKIVPLTIFMDCLKDARIDKAKIELEGKTRVFNIQPVDYTIQGRQYFIDFLVAFRSARLSAENTVGINVNGPQWSELYHHLNSFSPYILTGDFQSFGDILDTYAMYKIYHRICDWYDRNIPNSKFKQARRVSLYEFLHAIHLSHDLVYMVMNGQPSGCGWTVETNSLYGMLLLRVAFKNLTTKRMVDFDTYVRAVTNGDDWIIAVHPSIIDVFNNTSLQVFFLEKNIVYTDGEKRSVIQPYISISEARYLKCKFVSHPVYSNDKLAELELKSVTECCQWVVDSDDFVGASLVNSLASVRLAYGLGKDFYEQHRQKLRLRWLGIGYVFDPPTWDEEDERIWDCRLFRSDVCIKKLLPQMDDAHGKEKVKVTQAVSTVLESQRDSSTASLPAETSHSDELCAGGCTVAASSKTSAFSTLVGRWLMVKNFEWSTSHAQSQSLVDVSLPYEAVNLNKSVPTIMPFKIHRYWRGDMEIRVLVNSNKFQVGQLQVSWYYCAEEDLNYGVHRNNVYNASQRIHGLVSAGSSNEVIIKVPYRHYLSSLYTSVVGSYITSALNMGNLLIMPISRLEVTSSSYNSANCQLMVRFSDSCFTATVDQSLGVTISDYLEDQMEVIDKAMKGLNCLLSDGNRDNPPNLRSPSYFVPTVSHSFSIGKGDVEQLQCLRLDPSGQTPHPRNLPDEMMIKRVCTTFGLLTQFEWNNSSRSGTKIWAVEFAPMLEVGEYHARRIGDETFYDLPPVSVVSSLFCYWRGDLEFRFDVVASQFHSGKILVSFIPGLQDSNFTMQKAQGSPYQIYDIQEGRQFVFRAPYVACRPWWPMKYSSCDSGVIRERLGTIIVYVLNPLIPMDNVSSDIQINVYMRAGSNFELSIPSTPKLGSANYPKVVHPNRSSAHVMAGYTPSFTTFSHTYLDGIHLTLYRANTSGAIAYWTQLIEGNVYQKEDEIVLKDSAGAEVRKPHRLRYYDASSQLQMLSYVVKAFGQSYPIVYCFAALTEANAYVSDKNPIHAITYKQGGPYEEYYDGSRWLQVPKSAYVLWHQVKRLTPQVGENTKVEAPVVSLLPPVKTTDYGNLTFGEACKDLKDLCRRYSRYFAPLTYNTFNSLGDTWSFCLPIMPQRLALLTEDASSVDNVMREGHISLISSGYRFSRGGLRFRIVFYGVQEGEQVFVQLRPDAPCYSDVPSALNTTSPDFTSFMDTAYPCVYQGFVINNVIEFEVPWYMTGEYNLLQRIKFPRKNEERHRVVTEFSSLGSIYIFMSSYVAAKSSDKLRMEIFYSLADDCRFSTFVGFPPTIFIRNV
nr:MAG: RNA-dependent RNA polymerase [Slater picorna-like virus]